MTQAGPASGHSRHPVTRGPPAPITRVHSNLETLLLPALAALALLTPAACQAPAPRPASGTGSKPGPSTDLRREDPSHTGADDDAGDAPGAGGGGAPGALEPSAAPGRTPDSGPPSLEHATEPTVERFAIDHAPPGVLRVRGSLPLRAWRSHVRIYSDLPLDCERLANVAQWTRDRSFRWLSDEPVETGPVEIFIAASEAELRRLERELPLPGARPLARTSKGGYFHSHLTILLVVEPGRNTEWLVSHEMFHSVFRTLAKSNPPALNEGLAEVVPSWILFGSGPTPQNAGATYPAYEQMLEEVVAGGRVPALADFLRMSRDEFHFNRWANFSLAWSLSRLLVESKDPEISGRLPELVGRLYADPWEAFCEVYDGAHVERAWRRSLGLDE